MKLFAIILFVFGLALGLAAVMIVMNNKPGSVPAAPVGSSFIYTFNDPGTLEEAGSSGESTSPYFWLNSGGQLVIQGSTGATMSGEAPTSNKWRAEYADTNPIDTDNGAHPQNIFRLITRALWGDVREEVQFLIVRDNLSASANRNASNGLLLMSHYSDAGQTLYYAGIRVDGTAVIKKKYKGTYYTMAQKPILPGTYLAEQENKNLLPHNEWIGLRSETVTGPSGVTARLYMQRAGGQWQELLEAEDNGQYEGTPPIAGAGYGGIRTDFMDVRFENYRLDLI